MPFSHDTEHSLACVVDLVNSAPVSGTVETLSDLDALGDFVARHDVSEVSRLTVRDLREVHDLREAIHAHRTMRCELGQMRATYDAGDLDGMARLLIVPRIAPRLVYARNDRWLPALEHMLADRGGFVAVGLAHLIGDRGLPELLARAGYTVIRAT